MNKDFDIIQLYKNQLHEQFLEDAHEEIINQQQVVDHEFDDKERMVWVESDKYLTLAHRYAEDKNFRKLVNRCDKVWKKSNLAKKRKK
jgi:hypothetical protein